MDSRWEPKQTTGARRWRGAARVPRAPRAPGALGAPGAQACQARLVRQMRHVLHMRQVRHVLHPRQARGARRVGHVRKCTRQHLSETMPAPTILAKIRCKIAAGWKSLCLVCTPAVSSHLSLKKDRGPARTKQDSPPHIPVKTQCKVIAGRPRTAQYCAAKCTLYCIFTGMAGGGGGIVPGLHTAGNMRAPPPSLSKTNTK